MTKLTRLIRRVDQLEDSLKSRNPSDMGDFTKLTAEIKKLWEAVDDLKSALEKLRRELLGRLRDFEELLSRKADSSELSDLQCNFQLVKLEEALKALSEALSKRFSEKSETKRAFKYMESRLNELLIPSTSEKRDGEDAMIARKYLGGWSCLSCEKALEKLKGRLTGYQPWNKLPKRDPADRIARVGPGFSKMLATFQPEMLSSASRQPIVNRKYSPVSQSQGFDEDPTFQEAFQLPPVSKAEFRSPSIPQ